MIQGPMRASPNDADSVIELANECFPNNRDVGGILACWPHNCYQLTNRFIMKDGNKVVSHVGYADQTILVEGKEIKVAGVTLVSTLPTYRRQNFMTQLLMRCIQAMIEEGYAFSDLGGDRQRYGYFGWENAGREWELHITKRSLDDTTAPIGFQITPYQESSEEIDAIIAIHDHEPLRTKRTRELYKMLLGRKGNQVWLASNNDGIVAYVVSEPSKNHQQVMEFGGSEEGIHAILRYFIDTICSDSIRVNSPWIHPLNHKLFCVSSRWNVVYTRMLKIINLESTLCGFINQLGRRYREFGFQSRQVVSVGIEGTDQIVELEFSPDEVNVRKISRSSETLMLSEQEMVRFVFGPGVPSAIVNLPFGLRYLDAIFPVDFYLWGNERV
jgi:predicted N-acetyltransferase YhbS